MGSVHKAQTPPLVALTPRTTPPPQGGGLIPLKSFIIRVAGVQGVNNKYFSTPGTTPATPLGLLALWALPIPGLLGWPPKLKILRSNSFI